MQLFHERLSPVKDECVAGVNVGSALCDTAERVGHGHRRFPDKIHLLIRFVTRFTYGSDLGFAKLGHIVCCCEDLPAVFPCIG